MNFYNTLYYMKSSGGFVSDFNLIVAASAILFLLILIFILKRKKRMVGQKVTIEYFDKNDDFKSQLPSVGTIKEQVKIDGQLVTIIGLDETLHYHNRPYSELFVKERYEHERIKHNSESHAFILLPELGLDKRPDQLSQFDVGAWSIIRHTDVEQH